MKPISTSKVSPIPAASMGQLPSLLSSRLFRMLAASVLLVAFTNTWLLVRLEGMEDTVDTIQRATPLSESSPANNVKVTQPQPSHLYPPLPYLPIFPRIDRAQDLIHQTLYENKPSIAGIAAILYRFLTALHASNQQLAMKNIATNTTKTKQTAKEEVETIRKAYFRLVQEHLLPLDEAYSGRSVFPIRDDDSIFLSVASFREHLLADTLFSAFGSATHPQRLFVGVVVNNCFGMPGEPPCQGSPKVIGHDRNGRDILELQDNVADLNHIQVFCGNTTFAQYCQSGQVRVLYVHETDALGPAVTRYYTSKLWGGETFYCQVDAHLKFANGWDTLYVQDLKLTKNYPKSVLSTYPPGFVNFRQSPPYTPGTRLCRCQVRSNEGYLPRIEMEGRCSPNETRPTQMPFLGAGFFFARAEFLIDVSFDPFVPWLFMGEEIALSIRAWTSGWNIYAPRQNLIGHQYRPLAMHTPHYWQSVSRLFHNSRMVDQVTNTIRQRIKIMMGGYPEYEQHPYEEDLTDPYRVTYGLDRYYGLGKSRSATDYLKFAEIDLREQVCGTLKWCTEGRLE